MQHSSSGMTGPAATTPRPEAETTSPRHVGRLLLFALGMVVTIGAAAALPLWLLG